LPRGGCAVDALIISRAPSSGSWVTPEVRQA
jgi:hypothetical protein